MDLCHIPVGKSACSMQSRCQIFIRRHINGWVSGEEIGRLQVKLVDLNRPMKKVRSQPIELEGGPWKWKAGASSHAMAIVKVYVDRDNSVLAAHARV